MPVIRLIIIFLLYLSLSCRATVLDEYPELKKFVFTEPESRLYIGFGASPIGIMKNKVFFTADIFQIHWLHPWFDIELFNASFGLSIAKEDIVKSRHFTAKASPKLRLGRYLSIGPVGGIEYVSFPDLVVRTTKGGFWTPSEPFSSTGFIYGVAISQLVQLGKNYVKINELFYKQTYRTKETSEGWIYFFDNPPVQADRDLVAPGWVFMLAVSLLY